MSLNTFNKRVEVRERGEDDSWVSGLCSWVDSCAFNGDIPHHVALFAHHAPLSCTPCRRHTDQRFPTSGSLKPRSTLLPDGHTQ